MFGKLKELLDKRHNQKVLRKNKVQTNKMTIYGRIILQNYGSLNIGNNVIIISEFKRNVVGGYPNAKLYVKKGATLTIGNNVGISNSVITSYNSITIEDNVLIGAGCLITDSDHHPVKYAERV